MVVILDGKRDEWRCQRLLDSESGATIFLTRYVVRETSSTSVGGRNCKLVAVPADEGTRHGDIRCFALFGPLDFQNYGLMSVQLYKPPEGQSPRLALAQVMKSDWPRSAHECVGNSRWSCCPCSIENEWHLYSDGEGQRQQHSTERFPHHGKRKYHFDDSQHINFLLCPESLTYSSTAFSTPVN